MITSDYMKRLFIYSNTITANFLKYINQEIPRSQRKQRTSKWKNVYCLFLLEYEDLF